MRRKEKVAPIPEPAPPPINSGRFSESIRFVTADWGNRFLKQQLTGDRTSFTVMQNSVSVMSAARWKQAVDRFGYSTNRFPNTQVFGFRSREDKNKVIYVAVGDHARNFGIQKDMTEEIKYDYDLYWGAITCSQLLTLFPDGNEHIVLALAHPTKSFGQRNTMIRSSLGKHHVFTVDDREVRFVVREVLPWDEPVGGIVAWANQPATRYNVRDLRQNDRLLVVDIGGGVTSFTQVLVDYSTGAMRMLPVYEPDDSPSASIGQRHVLDRLRDDLRDNHEGFAGMKNIYDDMLEEGIRTGYIYLSGEPVDVSENRERAEMSLMDTIRTIYRQRLEGGRPFKAIITTGGGMHTYHERLLPEWKHKHVETASDLDFIHRANLNGGDLIFHEWIDRQRRLG